MECDVLVAGGGSAGLAAAVASARLGARTVLVERHGSLGGMASAALVHSICGLYQLPVKGGPPVLTNDGFTTEFARRLEAAGGASGPVRMGRVDVLLQRPAIFAMLADQIVRETPGLTVRLHSEVLAAGETVTLSCRGRTEILRPGAQIDATGDAVLAFLRGAECEMEPTERLQRPAFIFALGGVSAEELSDEARLRLARKITLAVRAGRLPEGALGAHVRESSQAGEVFVTIDLTGGPDFDPLDPVCLTRLEMEGRDLATQLIEFFRQEVEGFSQTYVAAWPSRAGVRESWRIVGRYRLEADDLTKGTQFSDTVAFATWPMELRETATGPRLRYPTGEMPCGVPLRALQSRDVDDLFMAGRCISCSHEAQASIRVIGTCLATGEAAGLAAALQALGEPCNAPAVLAARRKISR